MPIKREALHVEGPTLGYAAAMQLAGKVGAVTPFVVWPVAVIMAFVLHQFWPDNMWVLSFLSVVSVGFAWFGWYLTHDRKGLASEHMVLTILAYGAIFCMVDHAGWTRLTVFLMTFGVFALCCSWAMRNIVRHHDATTNNDINGLFETAGIEGAKAHFKSEPGETRKRMSLPWTAKPSTPPVVAETVPKTGKQRTEPISTKRVGKIVLRPGETADDIAKKARNLESAGKYPPGTFQITTNEDRADVADLVMSDPRAIKNPSPYPGPSYLGGSIADTLSVGMYQDGTEIEFDILGLQLQIMGMIGSAKSLGAGWNTIAEIVTRYDAVVWGIDVTKGDQTLGPLNDSLHRLATTPEKALKILNDANALIKPRTEWLTKHGFQKWQKDCGLKYLVVWLEEAPDIMEALEAHERGDLSGVEIWIKSVKAARSAGITFAWSLQRADFSQLPTIARGQAAKWCFGVADSHEASFGLSKMQDDAGCEPERWGNRFPGKCFLDAPSIPVQKVPMQARTWYWGPDDKLIRKHAEAYPSSAREPDEVMKAVLPDWREWKTDVPSSVQIAEPSSTVIANNGTNDESENTEVIGDVTNADLDKPIEPLTNDFPMQTSETMSPVEARLAVRNWLTDRAGKTVTNADLVEVAERVGRKRAWRDLVMKEFMQAGIVRKIVDDNGISWAISPTANEVQEGELSSAN